MIKRVYLCDGDGCRCRGGILHVAADKEELRRQIARFCGGCDMYEEVDVVDGEDGKYVVIAVKIDS